ncbi:Co-chaperone Hsc20 [Amylocystis lapponica]|nr:Co-chaperone Hsc20 [Amylocystis lapponica]
MLRLPPLSAAAAARSRHCLQRPVAGVFRTRHTPWSPGPQTQRLSTSSSSHAAATCPQCSTPLPTPLPVCPRCSYISTIPSSMSYHEMLGSQYEPNPFLVDNLELKNRFRDLQSVIHPDRWVGTSEGQQTAAAIMSARINEALYSLTHPLRRIEYILEREGHGRLETDSVDDPELLMEIMDARETLAAAESSEEAEEVRSENAEKLKEISTEIESLVAAKDWPAVRVAAVKLKYLYGIDFAAASWPDQVHDH